MMRAPEARLHINPGSCRQSSQRSTQITNRAAGAIHPHFGGEDTPLQQSFANSGARKFSLECPQLLDDGGELLADGSQVILDAQVTFRIFGM